MAINILGKWAKWWSSEFRGALFLLKPTLGVYSGRVEYVLVRVHCDWDIGGRIASCKLSDNIARAEDLVWQKGSSANTRSLSEHARQSVNSLFRMGKQSHVQLLRQSSEAWRIDANTTAFSSTQKIDSKNELPQHVFCWGPSGPLGIIGSDGVSLEAFPSDKSEDASTPALAGDEQYKEWKDSLSVRTQVHERCAD